MNPVLFLDFDGPLFPERVVPHSKHIDEYPGKLKFHEWITYWEMDVTSVRQLNHLYDIFQFDTVISSSWKHYVEMEQVVELFQANSLRLHLHDDWCTPDKMSSYRVNDISWWIQEHQNGVIAPSHIILDDPWSGTYLENWKEHGLQEPVMVDPNVGISVPEFKTMKSIVQSWEGDYVSRTYTRVLPERETPYFVDMSQLNIRGTSEW